MQCIISTAAASVCPLTALQRTEQQQIGGLTLDVNYLFVWFPFTLNTDT